MRDYRREPIDQLVLLGIHPDVAAQMVEDAVNKTYPIRKREVIRKYGITEVQAVRAGVVLQPIRF